MNKPVKSSLNPVQEDEIASIDAQLDYVNKVLKWSILDLEKFIHSLKTRLMVEETYVTALVKITKHSNSTDSNNGANNMNPSTSTNTNSSFDLNSNYFGDYTTTYSLTTNEYEKSTEKTIEARREFIHCLKGQMELLVRIKDSLEQRRKKVKAVLGEKNTNYITFRTRDIVKLQKSYINKCMEYASLQQQILISSHHEETNPHHQQQIGRISVDEQRTSSDSNSTTRGDVDNHSMDSTSSPPYNNKKNSMAGFITQMRSQLANAAAAGDPSKQTARLAKLKKEISDTDQEYRQGIRLLEFLRKKQIDTAIHAMRHVEAILLGKSDAVKAVMVTLLKQEADSLLGHTENVEMSLKAINALDGKKDTAQFLVEYGKLGFIRTKTIYYDNYYYGRCKEILFGSNLNEYCQEHNRTVPLLVTKCIRQVEALGGLEKEGVYRISGRQTSVDLLKSEFEKDEDSVDFLDSKYDAFTIASVLKVYLRELKQPLFNISMNDRIQYSKISDNAKRTNMLVSKLAESSRPQRETLEAVINHLAKVESNSKVNKMTMKNLSLIFTPAIFHDYNQAENAGEWYSDPVLEDLINQRQHIFKLAESEYQTRSAQQPQQQQQQQMCQPQQPQQQNAELPSASVLNLPFSAGGLVSRKASVKRTNTLTRKPTIKTTPLPLYTSVDDNKNTPSANITASSPSSMIPPPSKDNNVT